jgi:phytoene dehydrogenase-like protein
MNPTRERRATMTSQQQPDFDVIAVGAGFAGLGLIHYLREAGLTIRVFDKAADIGGTWTWNRYPGAATDSEGYYYCLTFSRDILQEWSWSERYPGWEETHRYLHFVADKCGLWPHIQLNTEITSASYQERRLLAGHDRTGRAVHRQVFHQRHGDDFGAPHSLRSRASTASRARSSTRRAGRKGWTTRASGSASSAPAQPACRCCRSWRRQRRA